MKLKDFKQKPDLVDLEDPGEYYYLDNHEYPAPYIYPKHIKNDELLNFWNILFEKGILKETMTGASAVKIFEDWVKDIDELKPLLFKILADATKIPNFILTSKPNIRSAFKKIWIKLLKENKIKDSMTDIEVFNIIRDIAIDRIGTNLPSLWKWDDYYIKHPEEYYKNHTPSISRFPIWWITLPSIKRQTLIDLWVYSFSQFNVNDWKKNERRFVNLNFHDKPEYKKEYQKKSKIFLGQR